MSPSALWPSFALYKANDKTKSTVFVLVETKPLSRDGHLPLHAKTTKENESDAARPSGNLMTSKTRHRKKATWFHVEEEENSVTLALGGDPSNTATEKADENRGANQKHGASRSFAFG